MHAVSCKKGLYELYKVTYEKHNGKLVPIGEGYQKSESSPKFGNQVIKIRLGALYNESSNGPKEICAEELTNYLLHVQALINVPNPKAPNSPFHKVIWDVIIDEGHQARLEEHEAINADIFLQEEQETELANQFLYDDYLISTKDIEMANNLFAADNQQEKEIAAQLLPDKKDEEDK